MATGTTVPINGVLDGEFEVRQVTAATDVLTVTGAASQTGDLLVARTNALVEKFVVDKDGIIQRFGLRTQNKTANYTVVSADSGTVFTNTGDTDAIVYTLPTPAAGLFFIFANTVNQNLTVQAATANTLITFNDTTADSVAFSTTNEKTGGILLVVCDGTSFIANKIGGNTLTVA